MILRLATYLLTAALVGCMEPGACTLNIVPNLVVEIRDAASDEFLAVLPHGVVREGTYQDSLQVGSITTDDPPRVTELFAPGERAGRYTVHVEAAGYQAWDTAGVRVTQGSCHVNTARFTARLSPAT